MNKKIIIWSVFIGILLGAACVAAFIKNSQPAETFHRESGRPFVTAGEKNVFVDIALSEEEWARGLSGRPSLGEDEGMIFLSREKRFPAFWMKDMIFPIDIIWISDGKIVGIERNVSPRPGVPERDLDLYIPPESVDAVLEINAGKAAEWGVKIGDSVGFGF